MGLVKDHAIIAQNAATAAATLLQGTGATIDQFEEVRTAIFEGSLALGGAESVVTVMDTPSQPAPVSAAQVAPAAPQESVLGGGNYTNDAGAGLVLKFGKYAGKTIAQVGQEDPSWLVWVAENTEFKNDFVKGKVTEYLNANPAVLDAGRAAQAARA